MASVKQLVNRIGKFEYPVLKLEMRVRQRKARPFIVMLVYAVLLSAAAVLAQYMKLWPMPTPPSYVFDPAIAGRQVFRLISYLQMAVICLIAPAYSAGAISLERERRTLDMLSITLLSTPEIVRQKLAGALAEIAMLIMTSLPVLAIVFMLGGVSPMEVVLVYLLLMGIAVLLNAAGVFWSSMFNNTRTSMLVSYSSSLGYIMVLPILATLARDLIFYHDDAFIGRIVAYLMVAVLAGGMAALMLFGIAAGRLRRVEAWRVRAVRMGTLGGLFCAILLALNLSGIAFIILDAAPSIFELPALVNPFTSIGMTDLHTPVEVNTSMCITLGLVVTGTYLFQRSAIARLEILRRS